MEPDDDKTQAVTVVSKGTVISHYRIIEKIGAGGMGEVYLAEDTELNRQVALKFLSLHLCQDADCRARFKREAQAAAKLNHPNIVTIHEVAEFNGRPYFAMEHVEGQSLRELIKAKELPIERVMELAIQICEGLHKAHQSGIVHRDVKPANILIDADGRAKILDFGLATVQGCDHLTKTGSTLGTIGYMSPEQAKGEEVDQRSDIFSLGVVLYEMITGHAPFKADSEAATLHAITNDKPEMLARFRREVPVTLQTMIDKALDKNVATRYQHADELVADFKRLVSSSSSIPSLPRRRRRVAVPALLVLIVIVAGLALEPWRIMINSGGVAFTMKSIAVIPFKNLTGDQSLDPLGKMLADWTTQGLLEAGLGDVIPQDAIIKLNANADIQTVARETGATLIVSGAYYRIGDSIQFHTQIVNADEKLLQAIEPIYCSNTTVMDGIGLIRQKVMGSVAVLLDERFEEATRPAKPPTYDAYREWVRGMDFHIQGDWLAAALHFRQAFERDTTYLTALVSALNAYNNAGRLLEQDSLLAFLSVRRERMPIAQQLDLDRKEAYLSGNVTAAFELARKKAQLLPSAHAVYMWGVWAYMMNHVRECIRVLESIDPTIGSMRNWIPYWELLAHSYHVHGDHAKELEVVRRSRELHPKDIRLVQLEVEALAAVGGVDEIDALFKESLTLPAVSGCSPGSVMLYAGRVLRFHGQDSAAMACFERSIIWYKSAIPEKADSVRGDLALALYSGRHLDEAKTLYEQLSQESPGDGGVKSMLGCIAARQGNRDKALRISGWLKNETQPHGLANHTYWRACIAALLGSKDEAMVLLRESLERGQTSSWDSYLNSDFESLWDYPPYIELMKPKG